MVLSCGKPPGRQEQIQAFPCYGKTLSLTVALHLQPISKRSEWSDDDELQNLGKVAKSHEMRGSLRPELRSRIAMRDVAGSWIERSKNSRLRLSS